MKVVLMLQDAGEVGEMKLANSTAEMQQEVLCWLPHGSTNIKRCLCPWCSFSLDVLAGFNSRLVTAGQWVSLVNCGFFSFPSAFLRWAGRQVHSDTW